MQKAQRNIFLSNKNIFLQTILIFAGIYSKFLLMYQISNICYNIITTDRNQHFIPVAVEIVAAFLFSINTIRLL